MALRFVLAYFFFHKFSLSFGSKSIWWHGEELDTLTSYSTWKVFGFPQLKLVQHVDQVDMSRWFR
jgi:hypothetical protein